MKTVFTSAATTLENVKRSFYFLQLMAVIVGIPLLTYLQISHKDNTAASSRTILKTEASQSEVTGNFKPDDKSVDL